MPTYRCQVSLQDSSGLAKDQYVNTWYFSRPAAADLIALSELVNVLRTYYLTLFNILHSGIKRPGAHPVKVYLVGAPPESPPLITEHIDMPAIQTDAANFPTEVALCVSLHANFQPGVNKGSWRGRIYLGPFSSIVAGNVSNKTGRPEPGTVTQIIAPGLPVLDAAAVAAGFQWVIYSHKLNRIFPVARVSIDDAWDTQRRRGVAPTAQIFEYDALGDGIPAGPA